MQFTREIRVLIIHLTRRVYKSLFENLEDELNTERNKMKQKRIFEFGNRIQIFEWNANIRISEYSLTSTVFHYFTLFYAFSPCHFYALFLLPRETFPSCVSSEVIHNNYSM